jgi:uncharacterized membrane protein
MNKSNYHYLAIASLAIGIINLCAWLLPVCGVPLSIVGVVLGIISRNSSQRNLALIGIGMGCLGLLLSIGNALFGAYLGLTGQLFP